MPLSPYCLEFALPDRHNHSHEQVLLFSTRRGATAVVARDLLREIAAGTALASEIEPLVQLGLVVPDPAAEQAEMQGYLDRVNNLTDSLEVAIFPGMACNFACTYCYEGALKDGRTMSPATVEASLAFIRKRYQQTSRKRLILHFYGGEPLLYPEVIRAFCAELKPFAEAAGGRFTATLVSNGSLLSRTLLTPLLPLGLKAVKVTLDGPPDLHNQTRPYKNGQPSFAIILDNIKEVCDLVTVGIGGNFTARTWQRFPELLDLLLENGLAVERLGPVGFNAAMGVQDQEAGCMADGCLDYGVPWVTEATVALREAALRRGFRMPQIGPTPCMVEMDNGVAINVDGSLYKCPAIIGRKAFRAGDVWQGSDPGLATYCRRHWHERQECRACVYLPLCFGGCRFISFQRTSAMAEVECRRDFLRATLGPMLLQDMEYCYQHHPHSS